MESILARVGLALAVTLLLSGCAAFQAVEHGYGETFAVLEGEPIEAKTARKMSLADLRFAPEGWREYEIGRRYENGLGLDRDLGCAVHWYRIAAASPYQQFDFNPAYALPPKVTRYGLPHARIALRRIDKADPEAAARADREVCRARFS